MPTITKTTTSLSTSTATQIIAAQGSGQYIKIVGIDIDLNSTEDQKVDIYNGDPASSGVRLYGGANGAVYLGGRGGYWGLPQEPDHPWWILGDNTPLFLKCAYSSRPIAVTIWWYSDTESTIDVSHQVVNANADGGIITAPGAGFKIEVVAISLHNQSVTNDSADDVIVVPKDGSAGSVLVGDATHAWYMHVRGGLKYWTMRYTYPWLSLSENTALYFDFQAAKYVCGCVWYKLTAV